jgi:adenine-specific DNA-methyltransferase
MELAVRQNTKNKFGQYFTPKVIADFMIEMANISQKSKSLKDPSVLE